MDKTTVDTEKQKAFETAKAAIEKKYGKGSIMAMSMKHAQHVEVISTGSLAVNAAIGIGGFPTGRIIEIYGPESSGKSSLALSTISEAQKLGHNCVYIDAEQAFSPIYASQLGVDVEKLLVMQPACGEDALDAVESLARSGAVKVIVVDSVSALIPKVELEGEIQDNRIGLQSMMLSKAMRRIVEPLAKSGTMCIFINQIRMKIGVMFGSPETTSGGQALKFYSSVRIDVRKKEFITEKISSQKEEIPIGILMRCKVIKNKMAPPGKEAFTSLFYDSGISKENDMINMGSQVKVLTLSGSHYSYGGEKLGNGKNAALKYLKEHPETSLKIERQIMEHYNNMALGTLIAEEIADEISEQIASEE